MNSPQHLGERRFEKHPRGLDAEIVAAPSAMRSRGLWATALLAVAIGAAVMLFVG